MSFEGNNSSVWIAGEDAHRVDRATNDQNRVQRRRRTRLGSTEKAGVCLVICCSGRTATVATEKADGREHDTGDEF